MLVDRERAVFLHLKTLNKVRLWSRQVIVEANVL
jgi:hypothetical protein